MNQRWTREAVLVLRDEMLSGATKEELSARYGVQWQTLYKAMVKYDLFPRDQDIGLVTLKALHAQWMDGKHINDLSKQLHISPVALRSRWRRIGLRTTKAGPVRFPKRRLAWKIGLTIWTMRSKGKSTQEICEALGLPFEGNKSSRYIRHHLLRWCYDTHTKVPSFEYGTFKVKWLPPPTKPPTGAKSSTASESSSARRR